MCKLCIGFSVINLEIKCCKVQLYKIKDYMQQTPPDSYRQIHEYTYFDSATKKYLDRKRKNEVKKQQDRIEKQRRQLAQCTFKPAIETKSYYQISKQVEKIKDEIRPPKNKEQKEKTTTKEPSYQRLLNWGTRKQLVHRQKLIQRELEILNLTKSQSKQKQIHNRLNKSLEQLTRSVTNFESSSIKAVPILTREELSLNKSNYRTIHSHNRSKYNE